MKKHLLVKTMLSRSFVIFCAACMVLSQSCQKQDYIEEEDYLDPVLLNSTELAEFVIAGVEYQHTMNTLQATISKVNFSEMKFIEKSNGIKVMQLPFILNFKNKSQLLNNKKQSLLAKYPQFASLTKKEKYEYFQNCFKNSTYVNRKLLELGINISQPTTKGSWTESFNDSDGYMSYLADWMENPEYNEAIIIVFKDGSATIVHDDSFTPTQSVIPSLGYTDDYSAYYYDNKEIDFVAHTHQNSSTPSKDDFKNPNNDLQGLKQAIYYNGTFGDFFYCK